MKKTIFLLFLALMSQISKAQLYFPPITGNTWDTISPASLGWCPDKIDTLFNYLESENSKAFIVLKDGKIVIEHYFGTFTEDSLWYWASAGKSLTSFVVGLAQQEGYLNINDSTSKYLGSGWTICPANKEGLITVKDQLSMTTGLDDAFDNYCTDDTCLRYLADAGTRWAYHTGAYTILDQVILNATGQSINVYMQSRLKAITGMTGSFVPVDYNNVYFSKARSMARYGLLMLNHGNWDGTQIMTDTNYFNAMINPSQTLNRSYGYLWWLNGQSSFMLPGLQFVFNSVLSPNAPMDMYCALGKNGQMINIVPSQGLVWIRMGDAPATGEVPTNLNDSVWAKFNDIMCSTVSTNEIANENSGFNLFPNPAKDEITVQSREAGEFFIADLSGRIILSGIKNQNSQRIDLSGIANGIYFLKLNGAAQRVIKLN